MLLYTQLHHAMVISAFLHVQTWEVIRDYGEIPWPIHRQGHVSLSLFDPNGGPPEPALLVMWGIRDGLQLLSDGWIFYVNLRQWRKVYTSLYNTHGS